MAVHILDRRTQVAIETEGTEGTAETLVDADVHFRVTTGTTFTINPDTHPQDLLQSDLSEHADIIGQIPVEITMKTPLIGGGAADTAPGWGEIMIHAGFLETVSASTSVTYSPETPVTTASATIGVWKGPDSGSSGRLFIAKGCRAERITFTFEGGQPGMLEATFRGAYSSHADAAAFSPTYPSTIAKASKNMAATFGSWQPMFRSLVVNVENTVAMVDDLSGSSNDSGILAYRITGRKVTGSMDPLEVLVATHDHFADLKAGTERALDWVLGSGTGNLQTYQIPKCQLLNPSPGEREGMMTHSIDFKGNRDSSGDDEFTVVTT